MVRNEGLIAAKQPTNLSQFIERGFITTDIFKGTFPEAAILLYIFDGQAYAFYGNPMLLSCRRAVDVGERSIGNG